MDHHNKFDAVVKNIDSEQLDLKNKFTKLESDLEISRNVNSELFDQVTRLERKFREYEQYSKRKFIEISGISLSIKQTDLEKTIFNVFEKTRCSRFFAKY